MHIKYPKKKDFFTWEELGCLAKALGNQRSLFYKNIPPEYHKEKISGLDMKALVEILQMKVLHGDLHRTYNMHDALYNCRVIEKAAEMLSNRYLSFQELREVRVAFQLYEHEDMMGLVIDEHVLLRTLKVCGRSVSPVKLMQHIKHTKTHVQDRLLLYEFLDLLLLCERDADVEVQALPQVSGKDNRSSLYKISLISSTPLGSTNPLYGEIVDFNSILVPDDEKKITQLNNAYEQALLKPHLRSKTQHQLPWRSHQPYLVDDKPRIDLVSRHQQRSVELTDHLDYSNKKVLTARCGRTGKGAGRSFIDLNDAKRRESPKFRRDFESPLQYGWLTTKEEPREAETSRVNFAASPPREFRITPERSSTSDSQLYLRSYSGTTSQKLSRLSQNEEKDILVTPRDVHNSNVKIENLNWEMETQSARQKRKVDKYFQELYPQKYRNMRPQTELEKCESVGQSLSLRGHDQKFTGAKPLSLETIKVSPRKEKPKKENIYSTLKSRLQSTNSLLDFGEVEVPSTPFSTFLMKQLERKRRQDGKESPYGGPRTLKVEALGSLPRESELTMNTEHNDKEVLDLLDKFQDADFVATGKKGFGGHGVERQKWKHTTFV